MLTYTTKTNIPEGIKVKREINGVSLVETTNGFLVSKESTQVKFSDFAHAYKTFRAWANPPRECITRNNY